MGKIRNFTNPVLDMSNMQRVFGVRSLEKNGGPPKFKMLASAIYLQVSIISQALIFVTRSRSWSFVERPGLLLMGAFLAAQLVSKNLPFKSLIKHYQVLFTLHLPQHSWLLAGCHPDCSICKLELCCNRRDRMGLGWRYMAI